jgi:hypothetical protein
MLRSEDEKVTLKTIEADDSVTMVFKTSTAEFTPRVRLEGHPNWKRSKIQPLIDAAPAAGFEGSD